MNVFLAYNSFDRDYALSISGKLKSCGIHVWVDVDSILPGVLSQVAIQKAIKDAEAAIFLVGNNGLGDYQRTLELNAFFQQLVKKNIPLIPVLLPGVNSIPDENLIFLQQINWVSFEDCLDEKDAF